MENLKLTERRLSDRKTMAKLVCDLAKEFLFESEIEEPYSPRELNVLIKTKHGLRLVVDFDGNSKQPDVFVLSWFIRNDPNTKLSSNFAPLVNTVHYRKATDVTYGFKSLLETLRFRFESISNETAFIFE